MIGKDGVRDGEQAAWPSGRRQRQSLCSFPSSAFEGVIQSAQPERGRPVPGHLKKCSPQRALSTRPVQANRRRPRASETSRPDCCCNMPCSRISPASVLRLLLCGRIWSAACGATSSSSGPSPIFIMTGFIPPSPTAHGSQTRCWPCILTPNPFSPFALPTTPKPARL